MRQQRHIANVLGEQTSAENARKMGRLRCELINCELGEVLDLSKTGMRVRLKSLIAVKKGEQFAVVISGPGARVEIGVRVIWTKKSGLFSAGEAGLEFTAISEEAQRGFAALVRSIMV